MDNLLINKYKPKYIKDYLFDDGIKDALYNLLHLDEVSFILCGESSSGKTSLLQCIIKEYYENYKYDGNVLMINNVSDQGINYYRNDVKLFCQSNCTIAKKKKLVVFDDFDSINEQCQHVFRNYIDTYRHRVGFIFTTSTLHKIINSIQSRFLVIHIPKPPKQQVWNLCKHIIDIENINIENQSLEYILHLTDNTIYNCFTHLEKIKLIGMDNSKYNIDEILTLIDRNTFSDYFHCIRRNQTHDAIDILFGLNEKGFSVIDVYDALLTFIKHTDILTENEKYQIIPILCKFTTIFYDIHENPIELVFFTNNIMNILVKRQK